VFNAFDTGTGGQTVSPTAFLTLVAGEANPAVTAGEKVPNVADFYTNNATLAPDLGCHHSVDGALFFGPRTGAWGSKTEYWSKH
jgi:hypothetical protein